MPKGQKLIDWTPENDARLVLTILAVKNLHPNCEAVASAFGGQVNAMAISNRLSRLRKKAADEGLVAREAATSTKGRKGNGAGKNGKKGTMAVAGSEADAPAFDHEGSDSAPPDRKTSIKNQKVLTGRVTKARRPAKMDAKSKAQILDDSDAELKVGELDGAEGSGGENVFHDDEDNGAHIKKEKEDDDGDEEAAWGNLEI